ncbi:MAG TPA: hypothetical protein VFF06_19305 [Polyangia bacterium]|nr:hypothetical protein [Polyangia bacterium]
MTKILLALALALAACGNPETCADTCCGLLDAGASSAMEPGACPGHSYQTCGSLNSTVIDLRIPGQPECSYDTANVCSTGAAACLQKRDAFCGVPSRTPSACCSVLHPKPNDCP